MWFQIKTTVQELQRSFIKRPCKAVQNICDAIVCKMIECKIMASFIRRADPTPCFVFKPRNCLRNSPPHLKENSWQFNYFRHFSLKDSLYECPGGPLLLISAFLYIVETIRQAMLDRTALFQAETDRWFYWIVFRPFPNTLSVKKLRRSVGTTVEPWTLALVWSVPYYSNFQIFVSDQLSFAQLIFKKNPKNNCRDLQKAAYCTLYLRPSAKMHPFFC